MQALDQTVARYVQEGSMVGAELLVIKNRKTVLHRAYGFRDVEAREKMEVGTIFNIRSMTKSFTGAALQMLIEEGKVAIDDPVSKYLSEFDTDDARSITVRQLLTHRSGLPLSVIVSLNQYKDLKEVVAAVAAAKLRFKPGEEFFYSDAGTEAVAALVERVSGRPIDAFVKERLLQPLGMSDTFYVWDEAKKDRLASLYVGSRGKWTRIWDAKKPFYPFALGSQSAYGTLEDYAKFLAMWMDNGMSYGKRLLSPSTLKRGLAPVSEMLAMGSSRKVPTGFFGLSSHYGEMAQVWLKEPVTKGARPVVIGHTGSDGTLGLAWPAEDLIVCFFSQSRGASGLLRIETVIDATLRGKDTVPTPQALKPYLGTYLANFEGHQNEEFRVQFVNGKLALEIPSQLTFALEGPDRNGRWIFVGGGKQTVSFSDPKEGRSETMTIHVGTKEIELPRAKA
ncbi:MAG: serine hydrolase domain-containing protein [Fimbriimonas sp.]